MSVYVVMSRETFRILLVNMLTTFEIELLLKHHFLFLDASFPFPFSVYIYFFINAEV